APKPWLCKRHTVVLETLAIGLHPQGQFLPIPYRQRPPLGEIPNVLDGEVIEGQAYRPHKSKVASPATRQFNLVIGSFLKLEHDIHGGLFKIRPHIRFDGLRIKVTNLGKFTDGPYQRGSIEFLSWKNPDFPHHHMVTRPFVAFYGNTVDRHLRTLKDPQLYIYGIALYIDLYRIDVKEKITIILVKGADVISSLGIIVKPFVHLLLVVDIAF